MADEFGRVLVPSSASPAPKDAQSSSSSPPTTIDVARLIRAAEHYTSEMRRIGQKQSASDMEKNIRKARDLWESAAQAHSVQHDMRLLLEHEKATGIHMPHGHIVDPSGAVGLLWIRRSLSYQHRMFDLVLNHCASPPDAALQAYRHELQPYHGWALQKLYGIAMTSMTPPTTRELLAKVGGYETVNSSSKKDNKQQQQQHPHQDVHHHDASSSSSSQQHHHHQHPHRPAHHHHRRTLDDLEAACRADLQRLLDAWDPLLRQWKQLYHELDLEDPRRY
jgi:Glycolipid transfer protein (GLTP)